MLSTSAAGGSIGGIIGPSYTLPSATGGARRRRARRPPAPPRPRRVGRLGRRALLRTRLPRNWSGRGSRTRGRCSRGFSRSLRSRGSGASALDPHESPSAVRIVAVMRGRSCDNYPETHRVPRSTGIRTLRELTNRVSVPDRSSRTRANLRQRWSPRHLRSSALVRSRRAGDRLSGFPIVALRGAVSECALRHLRELG